jgi:hypothetical protein
LVGTLIRHSRALERMGVYEMSSKENDTDKVKLAPLGAVVGDIKRAAIVVELNDFGKNGAEGGKLKRDVEKLLGRPISYGSFGWHMSQLRAEKILNVGQDGKYRLTPSGSEVAKIVRRPLLRSLNR